MKTIQGFVFEVPGEELKAAYEKQAVHHTERAAYYEGKLAEWKALPSVNVTQTEDETARYKLLADLGEAHGVDDLRCRALAGGRLMEGLGTLNGEHMFQHKIAKHRTASKTFSFLAAHIAKNDSGDFIAQGKLATYLLTLDELTGTGLIGTLDEVMPGRIPGMLDKSRAF